MEQLRVGDCRGIFCLQAETTQQGISYTTDEGIVEVVVAEVVLHHTSVSQAEAYMASIAGVHVIGGKSTHIEVFESHSSVEPQTPVDIPFVRHQSENLVLMSVIVFGIGVVGEALVAVEQQELRVFLGFVGKQVHGCADTSVIEPVVHLSTPIVTLVFRLTRECRIGHPRMFKPVEMEHSACLHLAEIVVPILVGVSATAHGIAHTHQGCAGT